MQRLLCILLLLCSIATQGQTLDSTQLNSLAKQLYNQYGDYRTPCPSVSIVGSKNMIAAYMPGTNEIKIEQEALDICATFGENAMAAIAFILGHELSHAFQNHIGQDHTSFFAYDDAQIKEPKYVLSQKEKEADLQGAFGVFLLGLDVTAVFPSLIDKLYAEYELTDKSLVQYPPKFYRSSIAKKVLKQLDTLARVYDIGVNLSLLGKYGEAEACYRHVAKNYQGTEIQNAQATNLILEAINFSDESLDQYYYPVEVDYTTRLHKAAKAGGIKDLNPLEMKQRNALLEQALTILRTCYEKNNNYVPIITNILICHNLMGNHSLANDEYRLLTSHLNMQDMDFPQVVLMEALTLLQMAEVGKAMILFKKLEDVQDIRISALAKLNMMQFNSSSKPTAEASPIHRMPAELSGLTLAESFRTGSNYKYNFDAIAIDFEQLDKKSTAYRIRFGGEQFCMVTGNKTLHTAATYQPIAYSSVGTIYKQQFDTGCLAWNPTNNSFSLLLK